MNKPHPTARLKNFDGLETWEWFEDGVRKLELTGDGVLEDYRTEALAGEFVGEAHYALIIQEDCDIYKPAGADLFSLLDSEESPEDRLLLSFRKGVIPDELCQNAAWALRGAAKFADNRGLAGGKVDQEKLRSIARDGEIVVDGRGVRARYVQPDGTLSKTTAANRVASGIAGNFDASPRHPFCRQTGYSRENPGPMELATHYLEALSEQFRKQAPVRWGRQKDFVDNSGIYPKGWCLGDTVFTTITVNRNWRTAVHQDAGDYPGGYGNLTVIEGVGPYSGGYTGFPKYRIAVDVRTRDFLAMDVHEWHGNTEMKALSPGDWTAPDGADPGFERISVVCYARDGMKNCRSQEEERENYERWHSKFLSPKRVQALQLQERHDHIVEAAEEFDHLVDLLEGEG